MLIRKYEASDKESVLNLLKLNTPAYFSPAEEKDLIYYLENELEEYYVVEIDNNIVGAGGFNLMEKQTLVAISWDFIHPDFHRKGIGTALTLYRIDKIRKIKSVETISVRTSQLVYKFYEKLGFKLQETIKDYWDKGFDMYRLTCKLTELISPSN